MAGVKANKQPFPVAILVRVEPLRDAVVEDSTITQLIIEGSDHEISSCPAFRSLHRLPRESIGHACIDPRG